MSDRDELARRSFLRSAAGAAAMGLLGSGCGDDTDSGGSGGSGGDGDSTSSGPCCNTGSGATNGAGGTTSAGSTGDATTGGPGATGTGGAGAGTSGTGGAGGGGGGTGGGTPACEETEDDIEGPFYSEGAPIVDGALPGAVESAGFAIQLEGRILSASTCEPIAGATLDIWQADDDGAYDNQGFTLRGKVVTDVDGRYSVRTIVPGNYLNGNQYRPAHIHVKASAPGHVLLTTQLYFPDDPYNRMDPWFDERLLLSMSAGKGGFDFARFDFVLVEG